MGWFFGNDADDMRYPGTGLTPPVNIYDLSLIRLAAAPMALMQVTLNKMAPDARYPGAPIKRRGSRAIIRLWSISAGLSRDGLAAKRSRMGGRRVAVSRDSR
ncbi:MAG: hypothetical protein CM15mP74_26930 [Halieaceae bacterium]|nr:MAG: hypothetical protein CM15mP74_26930 [Halieaceae bacterium]